MQQELIQQIQTNPFLWRWLKQAKREWRYNTKVHKALARWPKKFYSSLCETDQLRIAHKLFTWILTNE